jgi:hypothetical protein
LRAFCVRCHAWEVRAKNLIKVVLDVFSGAFDLKLRPICKVKPSMTNHPDFSVVVKHRGAPPKPWRWEIYRAGRTSAIECSETFFETMTEAGRAGKRALGLLLSEHFG